MLLGAAVGLEGALERGAVVAKIACTVGGHGYTVMVGCLYIVF